MGLKMTKLNLLFALVAGIAISFPASAKLYKWVDDNGVTHYGETIPPEFANKDRAELNQSGRVIKNEEVLTPERRRAKEQEEEKRSADTKAALEQQRRDKTLISTYNSVKEIELVRNRTLQQVDARINVINYGIKATNDKLLALQEETKNYNATNRKIPDSLLEDIRETQARLDKQQQDLEYPVKEKAALEARFDADKERYIQLTGKK